MNAFEPHLTAEDHAYRHAADTYFSEKRKAADTSFEPKLLSVFHSFEEHWREFFAPDEPELLREYLATPFELRKAQFERFMRECRAWEVSFRHCTKAARERDARNQASGGSSDWADLKRRLETQRWKAEQVRELYDSLDSMLDRERQRRSHPYELLAHLRALGLSGDASLEDVKRQYKRLAKVHHPDRHGDAGTMIRISDAYRAIIAFYKVA